MERNWSAPDCVAASAQQLGHGGLKKSGREENVGRKREEKVGRKGEEKVGRKGEVKVARKCPWKVCVRVSEQKSGSAK
jgi:hypothetical protein